MNKNKKLVSLVAAIAMIFSMLSSFTLVSAAGESLTLSTPELSADGKTVTVAINYSGMEKGVSAGGIQIAMPEQVTAVTADPTATVAVLKDGVFIYNFALGTAATADTEGTLTTLTLTLSEGLATATDIKIADGSYIASNEPTPTKYKVGENLTTNTVAIPADPNAPTPKPTTDATPAPVATETPDDKPEIDDPVTATMGLNFGTPETSKDGMTVTVPVEYVGMEKGISAGGIQITMPEEVTAVTANPTATVAILKDHVFIYNFALGTAATADTEGTLTTLTLTLSEPFKYDNQLTFNDGSYIASNEPAPTKYKVGEDIVASNVVLPAFGEVEEPTEVGSIDMNKAITTTVTDTPAGDGTSQYFIIAKVMKGSDEAVYGTDYVAEYKGTKLTEAQYSNLINGHFKAENVTELGVTSMQDVIDNVKYVVYDKTVKVDAKLVETATGEIQNGDDSEVSVGGSATPKPTAGPSLTVSPTSKSMAYNTNMTVTATVKNPVEGGTLTYTIKNPSETKIVLVAFGDATYDAATGVGTARFASLDIAGTATITVAYVDAAGETITSKDIKVTVSKSTTGGSTGSSDDDDDTSSSGIIAPPFGGTATPAPGYKPNFQDLDSVPWAVEAINGLAARGMVKGRSETVFDPNANITRAEYCQMLVNAINAGNAAAQSTYTDVPSDAWYYNAVSVASKLGIVNGLGDGNFGPNELITRQDMAVMTYRAAQSKQINLDPVNDQITFEDSNDIASYAFEAVMTLQKAGIINGMTETTFEPLSNATRAQSAKILYETFVK